MPCSDSLPPNAAFRILAMPLLPLRDWLYLAAIILIVVCLALWHHSATLAGEVKVRAADARAVARVQAAIDAQKQADAVAAGKATHDLEIELAAVRALAAAKPVPIRLCNRPPSGRPVPAAPASAGGAQPATPPAGSLPEVPAGSGAGPDVGPGVQRLALGGDEVSAR